VKPQIEINGQWLTPPQGVAISSWLNEPVAVVLDVPTLSFVRYVRRFERVTAVRQSPRHKRQPVQITP